MFLERCTAGVADSIWRPRRFVAPANLAGVDSINGRNTIADILLDHWKRRATAVGRKEIDANCTAIHFDIHHHAEFNYAHRQLRIWNERESRVDVGSLHHADDGAPRRTSVISFSCSPK